MISYKKKRSQDAQTKLKQLKKSHNKSTFGKWQCFYYFHTAAIKIYHVSKLNIIFLPIYKVKEFFNIASLPDLSTHTAHLRHDDNLSRKVHRVVFNLQEKVV